MKKNILKITAFSLIISGFAVAPIMAGEKEDSANSNATVSFKAPDVTDPVKPVDPTDPTKPLDPVDPGDGHETGSKGPITIDYVPHLAFGEVEIDGTTKVVDATSVKPYVQVSDRSATGKGWTLSAKMGDFVTGKGTADEHTLKGTKIYLENGQVQSSDPEITAAPTGTSKITLVGGGTDTVTVMDAAKNQGMGTWIMKWLKDDSGKTNSKVKLEVNTKDARAKAYQAEINWTLGQQP